MTDKEEHQNRNDDSEPKLEKATFSMG